MKSRGGKGILCTNKADAGRDLRSSVKYAFCPKGLFKFVWIQTETMQPSKMTWVD